MSKVVLITGATRGIGFEIARQCGKKGYHIVLSGRDEKKVNEALIMLREAGIDADPLIMDVGSVESIRNAFASFSETELTIDVLINNAGIIAKGDKSLLQNENNILEQTINTNSYGPFYVTRYFLPLMKSPGRIIMLSSTGGSMNNPVGGWSPAYCVSKTFLNAITRYFAFDLRQKNISVNAVSPGWVRTDMGGMFAPRSIERGAETPVWLATDAPQELTGKFFSDLKEIPW